MAIEWEPANCPQGDDPIPASWRGLGDGSTLAFDDGAEIGHGEIEGRSATQRATLNPDDPNYSVADEVTRKGAKDLTALLLAASPERNEKQQYLPPPTPCGDGA